MVVALSIFIVVLVLIIWQPKGLGIGYTAMGGAFLAYVFGAVNTQDIIAVSMMVSDATLAFIGIILFSLVLDEIGFFEYAALKMARASRGSGMAMFVLMMLLGAIVAALFANDGAALILTPIVLAQMRHLNMKPLAIFAFVMAGGFIGDSASNLLIISNLTNIVTAGYFDVGFLEYAATMAGPNLLSIMASIVVLWLYFRKSIPKRIDISTLAMPHTAIKDQFMFKLSFYFLALLFVGYIVGDMYKLPVSIFALGGALVFLALASIRKSVAPVSMIKSAPWQVVWFSIGLYVVVYALKNAGLIDYITQAISYLQTQSHAVAVMGTGFLAAVLSSVMNNMPTVMVMDIAIAQSGNDALMYANLLGCNLGPKMTPIGSLATLLWLHVLATKGVKISWGEYMKVGLVITPPVLFVALLGLV